MYIHVDVIALLLFQVNKLEWIDFSLNSEHLWIIPLTNSWKAGLSRALAMLKTSMAFTASISSSVALPSLNLSMNSFFVAATLWSRSREPHQKDSRKSTKVFFNSVGIRGFPRPGRWSRKPSKAGSRPEITVVKESSTVYSESRMRSSPKKINATKVKPFIFTIKLLPHRHGDLSPKPRDCQSPICGARIPPHALERHPGVSLGQRHRSAILHTLTRKGCWNYSWKPLTLLAIDISLILIDFHCAILEIHRSLYDRLEERVEKVSRVRSLASLRLARTLSVPLSTKGAMNRANSFEKAFVKGKLFIFLIYII